MKFKNYIDIEEQVKIACSDGNWNYSPYMHGMANGLICALAILTGKELKYLDAPDKWLCDFPSPNKPVAESKILMEGFQHGIL